MPETARVGLVVHHDRPQTALAAARESMGYLVVHAASFSRARARLIDRVHLLITDLRLGEYNGLHLVLVAKHQQPDVVAVVVADQEDGVLRREAASMGATYLVRPSSEEELVNQFLTSYRHTLFRVSPQV